MKKVLFVATVVKTHIMEFHIPYLKMFKENGWETAVASRNDYENPKECNIPYCDTYYDIPFERFPIKMGNVKSYKLLKSIINEQNYDIIHCHTPVGAMLARLAAKTARKKGTKVIYTAHGFHFFKGAPLMNWLIYYPVEWLCSFFTDTLITINVEDYNLAKNKMHAKTTKYVPGVGLDLNKFYHKDIDVLKKKKELNIPQDSFVLTSVGELNTNKNHEIVIRALKKINNPKIHYCIVGCGELTEHLKNLSKELKIENNIHILGYRLDIAEIYSISNVCVFPSIREGLGMAALEGMACGLPLIVAKNRGTLDYCVNGENGFSCQYDNVNQFCDSINKLFLNPNLCSQMSSRNVNAVRKYDLDNVLCEFEKIYNL